MYRIDSIPLNDEARKNQDGLFVELPCGNTHYLIEGDPNGEWVVLVHGYATPYFIYDKIAERLVTMNYHVLRYDLLGRGLSERVKKEYTPDLFATQLKEITEKFLGKEKFYLIGTSMGGTITTTFAAKYGDRIKKLILLAPAGMHYKTSFIFRLAKIKGLGELAFHTIGGKKLVQNCAAEIIYSGKEVQQAYREKFAYHAQYKGFLRCTLSSLRNTIMNFDEDEKGYIAVGKSNLPVLVIWGTADKTMPYYQTDRMKKLVPQMQLITYEGSGHIFLYDEGERTFKDILPFLQQQ